MSESKVKQAQIKELLAKNVPIKSIKYVIITVDICEQRMIEFGKDNKIINNQDKWNHCHNLPILPFWGVNNCLPLLHMYKKFVYDHNTEERINEFAIGYMVNPTLNVNK